jgi:hypothetical protein
VTNLAFIDTDLEPGLITGNITWDPLMSVLDFTGFRIFFITSSGSKVSLGDVAPGVNHFAIPAGTVLGTNVFINVTTLAVGLAIEDTPSAQIRIRDTTKDVPNVSITGLAFNDSDPAAGLIGGIATWIPPLVTATIDHYGIFLADDSLGGGKKLIAEVAVGANSFLIPQGTARGSASYLLVYAKNHIGWQSVGYASLLIVDSTGGAVPQRMVSVTNVNFTDVDGASMKIGGNVTWIPPQQADLALITGYEVYLGNKSGQKLGSPARGTNQIYIPMGTDLGAYDRITVYTRNSAGLQDSGTTELIYDSDLGKPQVSVSSISFTDTNLLAYFVEGTISWSPPVDTLKVYSYAVYLAEQADTASPRQKLADVRAGTNSWSFPQTFALKNYTTIAVYTDNPIGEGPGTYVTIVDKMIPTAKVSDMNFSDACFRFEAIGGKLTWSPPTPPQGSASIFPPVTMYTFYMAQDANGTSGKMWLTMPVAFGTNEAMVPLDTDVTSQEKYLLVYAANGDGNALQGAAYKFKDLYGPQVHASNVQFTDDWPRANHIDGVVTWNAPTDMATVTHYVVYLSTSATGDSGLIKVGENTSLTAAQLSLRIPPTNISNTTATYVLVYTANAISKDSPPAFLKVVDSVPGVPKFPVSNVRFTDTEPATGVVSGLLQWDPPAHDVSSVTHYNYYAGKISTSGNITHQTLLGTTTALEAQLTLDIRIKGETHFFVFAANKHGENTQGPPSVRIIDNSLAAPTSIAQNSRFGDTDNRRDWLAGMVTWTVPSAATDVYKWGVFLASDIDGGDRVELGNVNGGISNFNLTVPVQRGNRLYMLVYAIGVTRLEGVPASVLDLTTPSLRALDTAALLNITFKDADGRRSWIKGSVGWQFPNLPAGSAFTVALSTAPYYVQSSTYQDPQDAISCAVGDVVQATFNGQLHGATIGAFGTDTITVTWNSGAVSYRTQPCNTVFKDNGNGVKKSCKCKAQGLAAFFYTKLGDGKCVDGSGQVTHTYSKVISGDTDSACQSQCSAEAGCVAYDVVTTSSLCTLYVPSWSIASQAIYVASGWSWANGTVVEVTQVALVASRHCSKKHMYQEFKATSAQEFIIPDDTALNALGAAGAAACQAWKYVIISTSVPDAALIKVPQAALQIYDVVVPSALVTNVQFIDSDLQKGVVSGSVQFPTPTSNATDDQAILGYAIYWGASQTSRLPDPNSVLPYPALSMNNVKKGGTETYNFTASETLPQGATHLLVFPFNKDGEALTGGWVKITDRYLPSAPGVNLTFTDEDDEAGKISGIVHVAPASDPSIKEYYLYYGTSSTKLLSEIAVLPLVSLEDEEEEEEEEYYALGQAGIASCPPGYKPILDDSICALAAQKLGLTWNAATFADWCPTNRPKGCFQHVPNGEVYNNDLGCDGGVSVGNDKRLCQIILQELQYDIPPGTAIPIGASHLVVFSANQYGVMNTGIATPINDFVAKPFPSEKLNFYDSDGTEQKVSGLIWVSLNSTMANTVESVEFSFGGAQCQVSLILGAIPVADAAGISGANTASDLGLCQRFRNSTAIGCQLAQTLTTQTTWSAIHVTAITKDGSRSRCISIQLYDRVVPKFPPRGLLFDDTDGRYQRAGGTIRVTSALFVSDITSYSIYYGLNNQKMLGQPKIIEIAANVPNLEMDVPQDTVIPEAATQLIAFSTNGDGDSLTGVAIPLIDTIAATSIQSPLFIADSSNQMTLAAVQRPGTKADLQAGIAGALGVQSSQVSIVNVETTSQRRLAEERRLQFVSASASKITVNLEIKSIGQETIVIRDKLKQVDILNSTMHANLQNTIKKVFEQQAIVSDVTTLALLSGTPVVSDASMESADSGQLIAESILNPATVQKEVRFASAPLFYLFAGFIAFCSTMTLVGSSSYAVRSYRRRKEEEWEWDEGPEPEPDGGVDDIHHDLRPGAPPGEPWDDDRPDDDYSDEDYSDEEYADDMDDGWMVEDDEAVPDINQSTWQAMPDEVIEEMPVSSTVQRMQFYSDGIEDFSSSGFPQRQMMPSAGAVALKDDDFIEAPGGDFEGFAIHASSQPPSTLRDNARRQDIRVPSPLGSSTASPRQSPTAGMWGAVSGGQQQPSPLGADSNPMRSPMRSSSPQRSDGIPADPFSEGIPDDNMVHQPSNSANPFDTNDVIATMPSPQQGMGSGAVIGSTSGIADIPDDPLPEALPDDDNYIVLEL